MAKKVVKRERGRPALPESKKRQHWLNVRFSRDDLKQVRANARKAGKTLTEWVRERLGIS